MNKKQSRIKTNLLVAIGVVSILTAIVLLLCFFLRGETKTEGSWTVEKVGSLTCSASGINYPFSEYDKSDKKLIKINVALGENNIKTISLVYTLNYSDEKSIIDSENLNHAAMSENFAKDNLGFDALGLKFSKFSNGLQMNLFANVDEISNISIKYFMLDDLNVDDATPAKVKEAYEAQGFSCEEKN